MLSEWCGVDHGCSFFMGFNSHRPIDLEIYTDVSAIMAHYVSYQNHLGCSELLKPLKFE